MNWREGNRRLNRAGWYSCLFVIAVMVVSFVFSSPLTLVLLWPCALLFAIGTMAIFAAWILDGYTS